MLAMARAATQVQGISVAAAAVANDGAPTRPHRGARTAWPWTLLAGRSGVRARQTVLLVTPDGQEPHRHCRSLERGRCRRGWSVVAATTAAAKAEEDDAKSSKNAPKSNGSKLLRQSNLSPWPIDAAC